MFSSVTRSRAGSDGSASAFSATITAPPTDSGTKSSKTERSKQSEVERSTPSRSARWNDAAAQRRNAAALRCSICTPLGRPVEPEV